MKVAEALQTQRDKAVTEFEKLIKPGSEVSVEEERRAESLLRVVEEIDERLAKVNRADERRQQLNSRTIDVDIAVTGEPMTYGPTSGNSYFADLVRSANSQYVPDMGASQRMARWAHEVEREISDGSAIGKKAEASLREQFRSTSVEVAQRAMTDVRDRGRTSLEQKEQRTGIVSAGGASASAASGGAAFVTPLFFVDKYAPYREYGRAFIDQCNKQTLPDWGMEVYIPVVTGPAGVAQQNTEGAGVQETDPTFGYKSGALITQAGQVIVSQQLLDRAGPNFSFDSMIFDQLQRDYAPKVDTYALTQVLAGAGSQPWTGSSGGFDLTTTSGSGGFYGQVSKAKAAIRTTAGTVLNATHLFVSPQIWEYIAATADSTGRPIVVPDYAGVFNAAAAGSNDGDAGIEGVSGYRLNGLPVFTDANIPSIGTTSESQAIVGDLAEVFVYEGALIPRVIPQTLAQSLQTILQVYSYVAIVVRYPLGVVSSFGTPFATPTYTN